MATKNIYLYEVTIKDESTGNEVPLHLYKTLIQSSMQNVYTRYKDLILTVSGRDTPNPQ